MPLRLAVGLGITAVMVAIAGRRFLWIGRLISAGQAAVPSRIKDVPKRIKAELVEVGGQKKLLQWTVPGMAHAFTFWGFTILSLTILEAFGALFQRDFHIPLIGHTAVIGFLEDFFAVAVIVSLCVFVGIRVKHSPGPREPPVPFLRLAHRSRLDGAPDDLRGDGHPAPLPGRADQHGQLPLRLVGLRLPRPGQSAQTPRHRGQQRHRNGGPIGQHRHHHRLSGLHLLLEAPAHLPGPHKRGHLPPPPGPRRPGLHPGHVHGRASATTTKWCSARGGSRTSRGNSFWTWPPAPSAVGVNPSAPPGTPASRFRPSS